MLAFELSANNSNFEETASQLVAIAERTQSSIGGGSDTHQGEFYVEASPNFQQAHLLEMVSILLPRTTSLTIKAVKPVTKSRRRVVNSTKHSNGTSNGARRTTTPRSPRKQRVKV